MRLNLLGALCLTACAGLNPCWTQASASPEIWRSTDEGQTHYFSGFVCPRMMNEWSFSEITVNQGAIRGMDVACHMTHRDGPKLTVYLVHTSQVPPLEQHFEQVKQVMRVVAGSGDDRPAPLLSNGDEVTPLSDATRLTPYDGRIRADGDIMDTAIWMEKFEFWHVYVRASYYRGNEPVVADGASQIFQKLPVELPNGLMAPRTADEWKEFEN